MTKFEYFADSVGKLTFSQIEKVFACVKNMCNKHDKKLVLGALDAHWYGVKLAYEKYEANNEIYIPSRNGILIVNKNNAKKIIMSEDTFIAESCTKNMLVNVTGARPGDILQGRASVAYGTKLEIVQDFIPPSKISLDVLRENLPYYETFIRKLKTIPFFSESTDVENIVWLARNEKSGDFDLSETSVKVKVLNIGEDVAKKLSEEDINLLKIGAWFLRDVRSKIKGKPGTKARRHTLVFLSHYWQLIKPLPVIKGCDNIVYDMNVRKFVSGTKDEVYNFKNIFGADFGVTVHYEKDVNYKNLLLSHFVQIDDARLLYDIIEKSVNFVTPAVLKSLLQKIIRYASEKILIPDLDRSIDSAFFCCVIFTLLLLHNGSFVPDIQRFVSGKESALKRLLISITEDSYVHDTTKLTKLGVMSFLAQKLDVWMPTAENYIMCLNLCEEAVNSRYLYEYDCHDESVIEIIKTKLSVSDVQKDWQNIATIVEYMGSFHTDIVMLKSIAKHKGVKRKLVSLDRPSYMKLERCIDQHCVPEIAYFVDKKYIRPCTDTTTKPFSKFFCDVWRQVSGQNSRKEPCADTKFAKEIYEAQRLAYLCLKGEKQKFEVSGGFFEKKYEMNIEWIAGLVGVIDIPKSRMVTLKPSDPYQLIPLKKPSRGLKDATLSDEDQETAIQIAKDHLTKGWPLTGCTAPVSYINNYGVQLSATGEYTFIRGKTKLTWDEFKIIKISLFEYQPVAETFFNALTYSGSGISPQAYLKFNDKLREYSKKTAGRLLSYLSVTGSHINISKLSKDGGGTDTAVILEDADVWKLMNWICFYFPGVINRTEKNLCSFHVRLWPILWDVVKIVRVYVQEKDTIKSKSKLNKLSFVDTSKRKLRQYQLDALEEMITEHKSGKKGHFLWLTVGLGKTLIVLLYLKYLRNVGKLPKYILYTLPKSAISSIIQEMKYFNLPINMIIPTKSVTKTSKLFKNYASKELSDVAINLIEHDHLRLAEDMLLPNAVDTLVIIDEVHKALNETKRTSVALDLSRLSTEFIALTGTPMVDSNTYKLAWWLSQLVHFEINEKNFWVAANAMISKKFNTGIEVDKKEVLALVTEKEAQKYYSLVPPSIGGTNDKPTQREILHALDVCYEICYRTMVDECVNFLQQNIKVMLVVKNKNHQLLLANMLKTKNIHKVFILEESIFLSDESVAKGGPDYDVVIVPLSKSAGYTLTRMRAMITCVYPSNEATRQQLEGRINRVNQHAKKIYYVIVHYGILTYILQNHKDANSISVVLNALAKDV